LSDVTVLLDSTRPTQPPIQWVLGGSFPGGKAARSWSWPIIST